MTQSAVYQYNCDSLSCGAISAATTSSYELPKGWATFSVSGSGNGTQHLCPECAIAVRNVMETKNSVNLLGEDYFA